jgi:dimethylamine monooxygenase subunit A
VTASLASPLDPALVPLLDAVLARPWRFAMGLHALDPADWLIVTGEHAVETAEKRRLYAAGADIFRMLPEGEPAAAELGAVLEAHLARHHPAIRPDQAIEDPLVRLGLAVQEDLCLMLASPEGYRLVGAFVAFPARWNIGEKIGRPINGIHAPVPGLEPALGRPIDLFFERLAVGHPVWRANWSISDDPTLHQPSNAFRRTDTVVTPADAGRQLWLRVERQTLTRLPKSRAVVFTILTFVTPLAALAAVPEIRHKLAARLAELPEPVLAYKNLAANRDAMIAYLTGAGVQGPVAAI